MNVYILYFPHGKRYVGVESKPGKRIADHRQMTTVVHKRRGKPQLVDIAIRKHGWDNVQWRYLATNCTDQEGWALERFFIRHMGLQDPKVGYNISAGGECPAKGVKRSPEQRAALSARGKAKGNAHMITPEAIAKRQATKRANPPPPQVAWNKGLKGSGKASRTSFQPGLVPWNKGGQHTPEARAKMSVGQRGRPASAGSFKKGHPAWNKGRKTGPSPRSGFATTGCPTKNMVSLPAGPNGERRWFRPEQLI